MSHSLKSWELKYHIFRVLTFNVKPKYEKVAALKTHNMSYFHHA